MDVQKGNRVLVNIAPFIGSAHRGKDSIPCRVLSIKENSKETSVEVATEYPYRELSLWVSSTWIEDILETDFSSPPKDDAASDTYFQSSESRTRSSLLPV